MHGLGGESLPAASYGIRPNPKNNSTFCQSRLIDIFCHLFCAHQRPIVFYHTPGQLPPHDTGHCGNTVTLGWVGTPNERTPFRITS